MPSLTTPFGYRLETELANEFTRMDSEWFFRWHGLNSGREVDVDRFDGRRIRLSGVAYGGSDEGVYWSAVGRYLNNKINEVFELAEKEIRLSGQASALAIAQDTTIVMQEYCSRIRQHAIDTDRRLMGRGYPDPNYSSPRADRMEFASAIARRKAALVNFFAPSEAAPTVGQRYERFYERHKGKWGSMTVVATVLGIIVATLTILRLLQIL